MKHLLFALLLASAPVVFAGPAEDAVAALRADSLNNDDEAERKALNRLQGDKEAAVGPLLAELGHADRRVRERAAWVLLNLAPLPESGLRRLAGLLGSKSREEGMTAAQLLAQLGAKELIYAELDSEDPERRTRALYAAGKLDYWEPEDADRIEKFLADPSASVRNNAVWALGEARLPEYDAGPKLLPLLKTADHEFCARVCASLQRRGDEELSGRLIPLLASPDADERTCAAGCFGRMESAVPASTSALAGLLSDPAPGARLNAAVALAKLRAGTPGLAAVLAPFLSSEAPHIRVQAAWALGLLGPDAKSAADALRTALKNPDQRTRAYAASALASAGAGGEKELAELAAGIRQETWTDRANSVWGMAKMGAAALPYRAELEALLEDPKPEVAAQAAYALTALGPAAKASLPALVASFCARYDNTGYNLPELIAEIGPADPQSLPALRAALASKNSGVRSCALDALRLMGAAAAPAAPDLVPLLSESDYESAQVVKALAAIGPEAAAELGKALALGEYPLSLRAASALGKIGAPGLASLRAALAWQDDFAVMCASRALGMLGAAAAEALPDLEKLSGHPSPLVRARAASAAASIKSGLQP